MNFKKGDRLRLDSDMYPPHAFDIIIFDSYIDEHYYMVESYDCMVTVWYDGKEPKYPYNMTGCCSEELWYAEGRHVLNEITRVQHRK